MKKVMIYAMLLAMLLVCSGSVFADGWGGNGEDGWGKETCEYEGNIYEAGDEFPAGDGCNVCNCMEEGRVVCTKKMCPAAGEGEFCGGIANVQCKPGLTCELEGNYPDAGGICVVKEGQEGDACGSWLLAPCAEGLFCKGGKPEVDIPGFCRDEFWCDTQETAERDCANVMHIAIPGRWRCLSNQCSWDTSHPQTGRGEGEMCGGFAGFMCEEGLVCDYMEGLVCNPNAADISGICKSVPDFCTQQYEPVCGCDGKTYSNDCARLQAGAGKNYDGACCMKTGCSGQVCADESVMTTCEWKPQYACYKDDVVSCGRNEEGTCGWIDNTPGSLQECLDSVK